MWKRVDLGVLARVAVDTAETRKSVLAVDVHGARAADALAAGAAEGERGVDLVLDLDERIENLRKYGRARTSWHRTRSGREHTERR